jgi:hypothetical protein
MRQIPNWSPLLCVGVIAIFAAFIAAFLSFAFLNQLSVTFQTEYVWLYLAAPLSSAFLGPFFWWIFILRSPQVHRGRGPMLGVVVSLVAHPFTWILGSLLGLVFGDKTNVAYFQSPLSYTLYSLIYVGWITAIIGGLVGWLLDILLVQKVGVVSEASTTSNRTSQAL